MKPGFVQFLNIIYDSENRELCRKKTCVIKLLVIILALNPDFLLKTSRNTRDSGGTTHLRTSTILILYYAIVIPGRLAIPLYKNTDLKQLILSHPKFARLMAWHKHNNKYRFKAQMGCGQIIIYK